MAKVKPISPSEITDLKLESLPDEMIKVVNQLIIDNWNGRSATIMQSAIKDAFLQLYNTTHPNVVMTPARMFELHWMDFEDIYRKKGWKVEYDKPGYNESYEAFFVFKK